MQIMPNKPNTSTSLKPLVCFNLSIMLGFGAYYIAHMNYEFIIYLTVVIAAAAAVALTHATVGYSRLLLWGLSFWGLLHMAGGAFYLGNVRLYELILIPLSDSLPIFRYDQFVHIWGFGITTLLCGHLIRPYRNNNKAGFALWFIVAMAGLGIGAVNEILEFFVTLVVPESGVGDYINTSLDLIADIIGAGIAVIYLTLNERKPMVR